MDLVLLLRSWRVHRGIKYTGEKLEYLRRIKEAGGMVLEGLQRCWATGVSPKGKK